MTVFLRLAAAAAALGVLAWIVKALAILATGDQPPVLYETAPLLFAVGLVGLRVLLGPAGATARMGGLAAWAAVLLALASLAPDAGSASSEGDFSPLVLATFLCILAGLVLLGLPARRRADLPRPARVLPLLLGLLTFPLTAVGGALSVLHERLLELPLVVLGVAWVVLAHSLWTSAASTQGAPEHRAGTEGGSRRAARRTQDRSSRDR